MTLLFENERNDGKINTRYVYVARERFVILSLTTLRAVLRFRFASDSLISARRHDPGRNITGRLRFVSLQLPPARRGNTTIIRRRSRSL